MEPIISTSKSKFCTLTEALKSKAEGEIDSRKPTRSEADCKSIRDKCRSRNELPPLSQPASWPSIFQNSGSQSSLLFSLLIATHFFADGGQKEGSG